MAKIVKIAGLTRATSEKNFFNIIRKYTCKSERPLLEITKVQATKIAHLLEKCLSRKVLDLSQIREIIKVVLQISPQCYECLLEAGIMVGLSNFYSILQSLEEIKGSLFEQFHELIENVLSAATALGEYHVGKLLIGFIIKECRGGNRYSDYQKSVSCETLLRWLKISPSRNCSIVRNRHHLEPNEILSMINNSGDYHYQELLIGMLKLFDLKSSEVHNMFFQYQNSEQLINRYEDISSKQSITKKIENFLICLSDNICPENRPIYSVLVKDLCFHSITVSHKYVHFGDKNFSFRVNVNENVNEDENDIVEVNYENIVRYEVFEDKKEIQLKYYNEEQYFSRKLKVILISMKFNHNSHNNFMKYIEPRFLKDKRKLKRIDSKKPQLHNNRKRKQTPIERVKDKENKTGNEKEKEKEKEYEKEYENYLRKYEKSRNQVDDEYKFQLHQARRMSNDQNVIILSNLLDFRRMIFSNPLYSSNSIGMNAMPKLFKMIKIVLKLFLEYQKCYQEYLDNRSDFNSWFAMNFRPKVTRIHEKLKDDFLLDIQMT